MKITFIFATRSRAKILLPTEKTEKMKRVLCPRCDGYVTFDETRCEAGESLHLTCPHCGKSFSLSHQEISAQDDAPDCGRIVVLENNCCYRQEFPLALGDNVIGRRNKGTDVDIAIESSDADLERRHCILNVRPDRQGGFVYTLSDCSARSGTYLRESRLGRRDRIRLDDGAIVSIGGTTFILYPAGFDEDAED